MLDEGLIRTKSSRTPLHSSKTSKSNTPKAVKSKSNCVCKKFLVNPVKFYSNVPPILEIKTLDINKNLIDNYQRSYQEYIQNINLNQSKLEENATDYLSSFRNDSILINDPLNYELEGCFSERANKTALHHHPIKTENKHCKNWIIFLNWVKSKLLVVSS